MEHKNYYAVIPATIRYDPDLPDGAKLLYGEISALCNERGFCWATNKYFSELYGKHPATIKRWIAALDDGGYIHRNFRYKADSKEIDGRCISIVDVGAKMSLNPAQKCAATQRKNAPENITVNNTINKLFAQFWEAYPKKRSKDDALKAFKARNPDQQLVTEMLTAIQARKSCGEWSKDNAQYIPYPATWIRAGGWKDEIEQKGRWKSLD